MMSHVFCCDASGNHLLREDPAGTSPATTCPLPPTEGIQRGHWWWWACMFVLGRSKVGTHYDHLEINTSRSLQEKMIMMTYYYGSSSIGSKRVYITLVCHGFVESLTTYGPEESSFRRSEMQKVQTWLVCWDSMWWLLWSLLTSRCPPTTNG